MAQKRLIEDYVKTIFLLQSKGPVRGVDVAGELNVTKATVSITFRNLENEGYLRMLDDRTVVLTDRGAALAEEVIERNLTFYDLLIRLGIDEVTASEDACHLEHAISQKSFRALSLFLNEEIRGLRA